MNISEAKKIAEKSNLWAFVEARNLRDRLNKLRSSAGLDGEAPVLFETGYGPSGLPHIGTFGEVARTNIVRHAFYTLTGRNTKLICFSDDMDGFRKVPENVPNQDFLQKYLDQPLTNVPDPFEKYDSFGAHNNAKLSAFLNQFGFDYEFISATDCYKSGRFDNALKDILFHYEDIKNIILPTLGEERKKTYSPFLPVCPNTGKVLQVKIESINQENNTISYLDANSKELVTVSILGGSCKLQWKCDWAMRWFSLGVDYEMAGKDLSESVILSSRILKVLGKTPPSGFSYELFLDSNGEKISKSKGNGLSIEEWLRYGSPESLSLFMYTNPKRAKKLYFDIIPKTTDEYFSHLKKYEEQTMEQKIENPVWHLHNGQPRNINFPVTYTLLLNLASVCHAEDIDVVWAYVSSYAPNLKRSVELDSLIQLAVNYYKEKIEPFKKYRLPDEKEREGIFELVQILKTLDQSTSSDEIQSIIFTIGKKLEYENLRDWFKGLYETVLGQSEGPRMGSFIKLYGIQATQLLLEKVLEGDLTNK
ncbi:lysine--tRNA ligase [bacterium]|nr:lysine--tRNA ligase [bacterium]